MWNGVGDPGLLIPADHDRGELVLFFLCRVIDGEYPVSFERVDDPVPVK